MFLLSEYTTFADIEITDRGYRRLSLLGYMFGENKSSKTFDSVGGEQSYWRCTGGSKNQHNKRIRCNAHVRTRVIQGYEMIRNTTSVIHNH